MSQSIPDTDDDQVSLSDHEEPTNEVQEDENNEKSGDEDAAGRRVDPSTSKKKIIRRVIPKLDPARLKGPRGVQTVEKYFEGFKFHGKGNEKKDLDRVMKRLEHWAHRLFPKYQFDDFLEKVEALSSKKELQVFLTRYRKDMLQDDMVVEEDNEDDDRARSPAPIDEFDQLIAEQIERTKRVQQSQNNLLIDENRETEMEVDDEVQKRIEMNKKRALERKAARLRELELQKNLEKTFVSTQNTQQSSQRIAENEDFEDYEKRMAAGEVQMSNQNCQSEDKQVTDVFENDKVTESEEDIQKRIERNRQLAIERRLARMKQQEMEGNSQSMGSSGQINLKSNSQEEEQPAKKLKSGEEIAELGEVEESIEETKTDQIVFDDNKGLAEAHEIEEFFETIEKQTEENLLKTNEKDGIAEATQISNTSISISNISQADSSKKILTNTELDAEIGAVINTFVKSKRSSAK